MSTLFLVEMDTALRIRDWAGGATTFDSTTVFFNDTTVYFSEGNGLVKRTLDADMLILTGVEQDGTALTAATSLAQLKISTGSWYYDTPNRQLWVNTTDGAISTHTMIAVVLEPLAREQGITLTRNTVPVFWDGRVLALPSISQSINVEEPGANAIASFGSLTVQNCDGRYDALISKRTVMGRELRIYRGDSAGSYASFVLWFRGLMEEPTAGVDALVVPTISVARKLDAPMITSSFSTTTYPNLDVNITGFNIPKIWGTVFGAQAFRIASGVWKVASNAMTSITSAVTAANVAVTINSTDLPNGQFSVSATLDTEARLYVNCRGVALDKPGELMNSVLTDGAIPAMNIDLGALTTVDSSRAVAIGFQVLQGSIRDVLDLIARSAFIDWMVTRDNKVSAMVRARDYGNLITNSTFETDTSGWSTANGATLSRVTTYRFRGVASAQIVKPAAQSLSYISYSPSAPPQDGKLYVLTCMAAVISGTTTKFRMSAVLVDGTEILGDLTTLSATQWTRVTVTSIPITGTVITFASTTHFFDETDTTFAGGVSSVRIYPEYGGSGDVTVVVDDVEFVSATVLNDTNAVFHDGATRGPVLWRARAGYQFDGRTVLRRYASSQDSTIQRVYQTAESRQLDGQLVASSDASTVAQAVLDYFSAGRMRLSCSFLSPDESLSVGSVVSNQMGRGPSLPGTNTLFRVTEIRETYERSALPTAEIVAEGLYDPIYKQETITAS